MLLLSAWAWQQIPDTQQIPIHYGIDGTPDGFGNKWDGLLFFPLFGAGLTVILALLPYLEPRKDNLQRSGKAYFMIALASLELLFAIHAATVLQAVGWPISVVNVINIWSGIVLAVMGNYLGKVRSNFIFGIRTPWTLSSERSWHQTHRLGGQLFFMLGLSCIGSALVGAHQLFLYLMIGGTIALSLFLIAYSYIAWKNDPEH